MICEQWDLAVVPFPFTERSGAKRRPALVVSARRFNSAGHTVLAMVTTRAEPAWPGDTPITDPQSAGLRAPCIVRLKLFTLDNTLILKRIGALGADDRNRVRENVRRHCT